MTLFVTVQQYFCVFFSIDEFVFYIIGMGVGYFLY